MRKILCGLVVLALSLPGFSQAATPAKPPVRTPAGASTEPVAIIHTTAGDMRCDLFPKEVRTTGIAIVHDLTATALGSFTPFFITLMIRQTGSNVVPGVYVFAAASLAYISVATLRRRFGAYART